MASCNGCMLQKMKERYGDKLIRYEGSWYLRDSAPAEGQPITSLPDGTPIKFMAWFMSEDHSNDEDCGRTIAPTKVEDFKHEVTLITDGACSGNPGVGGWGAILQYQTKTKGLMEKEIFGGEQNTTNNRMELMAVIKGLEALTRQAGVLVITDSRYVKDGITSWISVWKRNGWRTAAKKPVKNQDLWERLDALTNTHKVKWHWVKGHEGHPENERADALAQRGIREQKAQCDSSP